jgi:hypothetical protein
MLGSVNQLMICVGILVRSPTSTPSVHSASSLSLCLAHHTSAIDWWMIFDVPVAPTRLPLSAK